MIQKEKRMKKSIKENKRASLERNKTKAKARMQNKKKNDDFLRLSLAVICFAERAQFNSF